MKKFRKIGIAWLALLYLVGCQGVNTNLTKPMVQEETAEIETEFDVAFKAFLDDQFKSYVTADIVTFHYTIKDNEKYGYEKPELSWGTMEIQEFDEYEVQLKEDLEALHEIDSTNLTVSNQRYYDIYKRSLEDDLLMNQYPYHPNYFSASSGIHENLLTILMEWVFRDEEDVQDYLTLLKDLRRYYGTVIDFGKVQISKGFWSPSFIVESSMESIQKFVDKKENNALIVSFDERVEKLGLSNIEEYKQQNKDLVLNEVIPAYQDIYNFLDKNKEVYKGTGAVFEYPNGKEYYEALARTRTSSLYTVDELITMGDEYYLATITKFSMSVSQSSVTNYARFQKDIPDAEKLLASLEKNVKKDYPEGPKVNYTASYLDSSITDDSVIAYYLSPPVDAIEDNVIRINGDYASGYLSFVNSIAHEGFPGHLYQFTYIFNQGVHPMFTQVNFMGYSEGWAMMAGNRAMTWLDENKEVIKVAIADNQLNYVSSALYDLKVNYLGWTKEDIARDTGITDATVVQAIYEQVIENPGMLLPYGVGMMMFDLMEEEAEDVLGSKFDRVEYNKVLLKYGFRPFEEVQKDVDRYVEKNK